MKAVKETKKKNALKNIKYLGGSLFKKMAKGGGSELKSNADEVNKLNVFPVPDGDTGDNMRMTIESGIAAIENLDSDDLAHVMKLFSHGMLIGARGNSGVILSQFFAGMAKGLKGEAQAEPRTLAKALQMGVEQAYTSVMTPTEGTILTVAREAVEYAVSRINEKSTVRSLFADLAAEMQNSLNRTPEVLAVLKEAGVVDSGGAGLFYIMDGFNRVLNGEEPENTKSSATEKSPEPSALAFGPDSDMKYGYCTEFLLQLQRKKCNVEGFDIESFKSALSRLGDSIVAFKTDSIVKCHIHTKTPEKALALARESGEFITVKIENMSVQHTESTKADEDGKKAPKKRYGIVAVSCGNGISSVFSELGADEIINGGQTNNPSTKDFLDAYGRINAKHIFVLPNNKNIILTAEQSAKMYKKSKIEVIPTKNVGAGYAALSYADLEASTPKAITERMLGAIASSTTGYLSPAVRDAEINGIKIKKGDTIAVIEKDIVLSEKSRQKAAEKLIAKLLENSNKTVMTLFYGKDTTESERKKLGEHLKRTYPQLEAYFIDGGQEISPYIIMVE